MIVTVKLGNANYKTMVITLVKEYFKTEQDLLNHINELIRAKVWEEMSGYEKAQYQKQFENFEAPPIIMMYSRNRYNVS